MNPLLMIEAALFQLRAVLDVSDEAVTIRLAADLFAAQVRQTSEHGLNAGRVSDLRFAFDDLRSAIVDTSFEGRVAELISMIDADLEQLSRLHTLPDGLASALSALRSRFEERAVAMERAQYRDPDSPEEPLPHDPQELSAEASVCAGRLRAAGFPVEALDTVATADAGLRYFVLRKAIEEIDTILAE